MRRPTSGNSGSWSRWGQCWCWVGLFFLRQYLLDRELMRLLEESRLSLNNLQRLQAELVQREKLASLAQLVSGAAHEINNPLAAILGIFRLARGPSGDGTRSGQHGAQDRPAGAAHPGTGLRPAQLRATVAGGEDALGYGLARTTRPADEDASHRQQEHSRGKPDCGRSSANLGERQPALSVLRRNHRQCYRRIGGSGWR